MVNNRRDVLRRFNAAYKKTIDWAYEGADVPEMYGKFADVPRRIGVETQRSFRGIRSGDRLDSGRDLVHAIDAGSQAAVGQDLVGVGEREIGDLVMPREMPQQMPRPQLAALVKRQQEIRF